MSCWKHKQTFIDRIDPKIRILICVAFCLLLVCGRNPAAPAVGVCVALILFLSSGCRLHGITGRLLALNAFLIPLLLTYPFGTGGRELFSLYGLKYGCEGVYQVMVLGLRLNAVFLLTTPLLLTLEPLEFAGALHSLGMPAKLSELILFSFRYSEVLHRESGRMKNGMKCRGFSPRFNMHTYWMMACFVGMLLLRGLNRAERVRQAMLCRGYSGFPKIRQTASLSVTDYSFAAAATLVFAAISVLEFMR